MTGQRPGAMVRCLMTFLSAGMLRQAQHDNCGKAWMLRQAQHDNCGKAGMLREAQGDNLNQKKIPSREGGYERSRLPLPNCCISKCGVIVIR